MKHSKFLPALGLFSSKNGFKARKDFDHFMRTFGYPLFLESLIRASRMKRSKFLPALGLFSPKNGVKAKNDLDNFTRLSEIFTEKA